MELPLYHLPNPRIIGLVTWQKHDGLHQACGDDYPCGIFDYLAAGKQWPNGDINTSVLAHIGKFFEPLGKTDGLQLAGDGRAFSPALLPRKTQLPHWGRCLAEPAPV